MIEFDQETRQFTLRGLSHRIDRRAERKGMSRDEATYDLKKKAHNRLNIRRGINGAVAIGGALLGGPIGWTIAAGAGIKHLINKVMYNRRLKRLDRANMKDYEKSSGA